jgi:hypothetical protein
MTQAKSWYDPNHEMENLYDMIRPDTKFDTQYETTRLYTPNKIRYVPILILVELESPWHIIFLLCIHTGDKIIFLRKKDLSLGLNNLPYHPLLLLLCIGSMVFNYFISDAVAVHADSLVMRESGKTSLCKQWVRLWSVSKWMRIHFAKKVGHATSRQPYWMTKGPGLKWNCPGTMLT